MSTSVCNPNIPAGRSGRAKLRICRVLLNRLDPDRPPATTKAKEFRWQYRALSERVDVYAERLRTAQEAEDPVEPALQRAEYAIDLSLLYFRDVLAPRSDDEA